MPESQYDTAATLVPDTPPGYRDPGRFQYSTLALLVLATLLGATAASVFGGLPWRVQGATVVESVFEIRKTPEGFVATLRMGTAGLVALGTVAVVTALHELLHGLAYSRYGYGVAPWLGAFYAAVLHQFQTRGANLLAGLTPLVVLDLLLLPLLFVPVPLAAFAAFVGLVFNTAAAAGDLYLVARLALLPRGTLLYDSDAHHSYVFRTEATG